MCVGGGVGWECVCGVGGWGYKVSLIVKKGKVISYIH